MVKEGERERSMEVALKGLDRGGKGRNLSRFWGEGRGEGGGEWGGQGVKGEGRGREGGREPCQALRGEGRTLFQAKFERMKGRTEGESFPTREKAFPGYGGEGGSIPSFGGEGREFPFPCVDGTFPGFANIGMRRRER